MKRKLFGSMVVASAVALICACGDDAGSSNAPDPMGNEPGSSAVDNTVYSSGVVDSNNPGSSGFVNPGSSGTVNPGSSANPIDPTSSTVVDPTSSGSIVPGSSADVIPESSSSKEPELDASGFPTLESYGPQIGRAHV